MILINILIVYVIYLIGFAITSLLLNIVDVDDDNIPTFWIPAMWFIMLPILLFIIFIIIIPKKIYKKMGGE